LLICNWKNECPAASSAGNPNQTRLFTEVQARTEWAAELADATGAEGAASAMAGSIAAAVAKPKPTATRRPMRDLSDMMWLLYEIGRELPQPLRRR
jgi:hypothetical protein